ncbi:guanitoxin biosynthesis L-enduracididine beta-hydroxylase GntD [Micromonospora sp. WMMA1923]|uniref:guanitoxin biosynthesis L-enduracididine beta-hydroxylase GntD n=1 Tax=Micromonospora sp. WMMA1923 TaxID=3404125 RepID=UPI003B94C83E
MSKSTIEGSEQRHTAIARLTLSTAEREELTGLVDEALTGPQALPVEHQLGRLAVLAHRLPERVRETLTEFRLTGRPYGGLVLAGLPLDESALGPTPASYSEVTDRPELHRATALLALLASLLGDPFSFLSQQKGQLFLDVFPVTQHENDQLGSSSTVELDWHNEDAFHEDRADWIMLLCLRNHDLVPTTFATTEALPLDAETVRTLFARRFVILPDESHTASFNQATTGVTDDAMQQLAFDLIADLNTGKHHIPILTGDPQAPMIRIDPAFMQRDLGDEEAERAQQVLIDTFARRMTDVPLTTGELLVVDNKRAVHGRRPFKARYDGTDRWLRRTNITADLRRTEGRRGGSHGRAVV